MKILAFGNGSGSEWWRLRDPFKYLCKKGHEAYVTKKSIPQCYKEGLFEWADIIVLEGIVDMEGLACIYMYQQEKGKKIVIEQDDNLIVDEDNPHWKDHKLSLSYPIISRMIEVSDLVTTTNIYLANQIMKLKPARVDILPNCMDLDRWQKPRKVNLSGQVRLGWCGSVTHLKDLEMIRRPLKRILKEFPNVTLILVGDPRYRMMFKEPNVEVMFGVDFEAWASKLNGLALDIGLGPLRDTDFNRSRSPIKWMEYSINSVAGVYSPTVYSRQIERKFDGRLGLIAHGEKQWYQAIKNLIVCQNLRNDLATAARAQVLRKFDLAKNAYKWERVYRSLLS